LATIGPVRSKAANKSKACDFILSRGQFPAAREGDVWGLFHAVILPLSPSRLKSIAALPEFYRSV
jgi:hypothetical protein